MATRRRRSPGTQGLGRQLHLDSGRSIAAESIQVLRIQDGRIAAFRDFADPRIFEELMSDAHVGNAHAGNAHAGDAHAGS